MQNNTTDKTLDLTIVTAPAHWASYLINGDATMFSYSGDEKDEQACYSLEKKYGHCVSAEEIGFLAFPDYGMPGDCCEYTFQKLKAG